MSTIDLAPGYARFRLRLEREEAALPNYGSGSYRRVIHELLAWLLAAEPLEVFGVLLLDRYSQVIGHSFLFRGTIDRALSDPAAIMALALLANSRKLILFHNHPSGLLEPSREDLETTRALVRAGHFLRVEIHDHYLFAGPGRVRSLREDYGNLFVAPEDPRPLVIVPRRDGRRRVAPKYRDPENPGGTWSGRGLQPRWLRERLEAGAKLEDFLISASGDMSRGG